MQTASKRTYWWPLNPLQMLWSLPANVPNGHFPSPTTVHWQAKLVISLVRCPCFHFYRWSSPILWNCSHSCPFPWLAHAMFGYTCQVPKRLCMYTWSVQTWLIWPYQHWSSPYLKVNTIMCSLGSASWLLGRRVCSVIRESGQWSGGVMGRMEETWAPSVCITPGYMNMLILYWIILPNQLCICSLKSAIAGSRSMEIRFWNCLCPRTGSITSNSFITIECIKNSRVCNSFDRAIPNSIR